MCRHETGLLPGIASIASQFFVWKRTGAAPSDHDADLTQFLTGTSALIAFHSNRSMQRAVHGRRPSRYQPFQPLRKSEISVPRWTIYPVASDDYSFVTTTQLPFVQERKMKLLRITLVAMSLCTAVVLSR